MGYHKGHFGTSMGVTTRAQLRKDAKRKPSRPRFAKTAPLPKGAERERLAKRAGEWSPEEDQALQETRRGGETLRTIAKHLGKSVGACSARKQLLGLLRAAK